MTSKTTSKTSTAVSALDAATAMFSKLEEQHRTAWAEARSAQEYADSLPGRLASGDETVSTEDLIRAAPAAAVAQAKALAIASQLTAARNVIMQAQTDELAAQLRAGQPFLNGPVIEAELDAIAVQLREPLDALAERFAAHNKALTAITRTANRNTGSRYTLSSGEELEVTRQGIALDGKWWQELSAENLGESVVHKIRQLQLRTRAANYVPIEPAPTEIQLLEAERRRNTEREQAA